MHLLPACRFLQNRDDTHFHDTYLIKENQDVEKKIIKSFFFFSLNFRNVQIDVESFVFCLLDDTKNDANIFFFFIK